MKLDLWDFEGDSEKTEHWRAVVPALSISPADDLTDVANDRARAASVRQRYVLELKHLGRTGGAISFSTSRLTRISDWSPLTPDERRAGRPDSPYVLCRGVPSGLSQAARGRADDGLDFAILISIPPEFLPVGPLFLDGVPLVIHARRPFRTLPANVDQPCSTEAAIPSYGV